MIPRLQTEYQVEDAADEDELRRIVGGTPAPDKFAAWAPESSGWAKGILERALSTGESIGHQGFYATPQEIEDWALRTGKLNAADVASLKTPAPAASTTDWMSSAPTGWGGFTGDEKIRYFNQQGITPEQLAPYATPEEIQYFYDHMGYTVGKPAAAPSPSPAPAAPLTPFDVFKQDLFTTEMLPTGASAETGADQFQAGARSYQLGNQTVVPDDQGGYVVNTPTAQEGIYKAERFDASGKKIGEFINDARNTDLQDLAQFATMAIGMGPLAGMLGTAAGSALGLGALAPGAAAALGFGIANLGAGLITGQDPMKALENAIKTGAAAFLPSQVSSFIPSTGTAALDAALKTATEAGVRTAINGGDVESAVVGSLLNSGVNAATGASGLPPELVNAAIGIARSGGDPQKIFNAVVSAGPAIQGLQNYYSKTDTGDETARLIARYGTADDNIIKQIEAMSPTGVSAPATTEDVQETIFQDVLRQSPTQQIAPASTEVVQQAIQDDLRRDLADIVYLNADNAGIKTQQEAAQQASKSGLPGFIFQGQTYRLSQAPGYLSPEGKLYPSEAAYVATLGPKTITIPGIQIESQGRTVPGVTAAQATQLGQVPLRGEAVAAPAAPAEQFVNPAVDFTDVATGMQGTALSPEYKPTTTLADIGQNLLDVRQNINQATNTGIRTGLSQLAGTGLRAAEVVGSAFGTAPERFAEPEAGMDELTSMLGTPPSSDAAVRDVQKELYDYQKSQLAALPNDAQRAFASGVASTVNTVSSYALGGPFATVANAAANTGNLAWMQGKEAGLTPEDNAKRSAFMAGVEAVGELAGVPFLKALFKEMPTTGSKDALTDWLATKLKAYGGEQLTENLTTAGQFAVDKFADFGIPSQATDFGKALGETIIATTAAFGGTGAVGTFYGTPGLRTVTTQAPPTPIEFLGSTPATQIVPTEGVPQQLTYQAPAAPPSPVQITGPEAAAPAPEIFGPESQLGFEEGVRPTVQQQLEEALSGVYEPPAAPAAAPSVPSDTTGITPEMVAFIDEDGGIVTYGDLGLTSPAPAPVSAPTAQQTAPKAAPATEATFAEPQMEEINRLFQDIYQQQNYPVATAPVTAPVTAPAQQTVIEQAPSAPAVAAPAQDLSAYQTALNQAVYGGTGGEPTGTSAPTPSPPSPSSSAPPIGTILSVDPTQGTALVADPQGGTKVIDVDPATRPGDTVNLGTAPDLTTPIATDPVTGETLTLGDVTPSAPAPSATETKVTAPAPAETKVTSPAPAPAETKTEAPAPSETKAEVAAPAPAEIKTEAPAPAPAETKTETTAPAPAPAPAPAETKTEVAAPAPAETKTETTAPAPAEIKTEVAAPAPAETKTEVAAPSPAETKTEITAPAPAPATEEVKTEAPAPTTEEGAALAPAETKTEAPAPSPAPSEAPAEAPAPAPVPSPAPAPVELPTEIPEVLSPVTPEELTKIVEGAPPSEPPASPPQVAPTEPAPEPSPAPPPVSTLVPAPAIPPTVGDEDILLPVTEKELRDIVSGPPPVSPPPSAPAPAPAPRAPAPSPAQTALAQLPPQQRAAVEQLLQEIFQAPEADLLEMFAELSEQREQKRKERGAQLKSRKA